MRFFSEKLSPQEETMRKQLKALLNVIRKLNQDGDNSIILLKDRVSYLLRNKQFWSGLCEEENTTAFASKICLLNSNSPIINTLLTEVQNTTETANKNLRNVENISTVVSHCLLHLTPVLVFCALLGYIVFTIAIGAAGPVPLLMHIADLYLNITGYGSVASMGSAFLLIIFTHVSLEAIKNINKHRQDEVGRMFSNSITLPQDKLEQINDEYDKLLAEQSPNGIQKN